MLTELQCKNAKPREKTYSLSDGGGLSLEIQPNGGRYWRFKYHFAGKRPRTAFGVYPEVGLAEARNKRDEARKALARGEDPALLKKVQKQQLQLDAQNTFREIATRWLEHKEAAGRSEGYLKDIKSRLEKDAFPKLGNIPIRAITTPMVVGLIKSVQQRNAPEQARRVKQYADEIFRFAASYGLLEMNPARQFETRDVLPTMPKRHHPCIDDAELADFLTAMDASMLRVYPVTRLALKLLMLTAVRPGKELTKARWGEFDTAQALWSIPAERMKMKRPHLVPLSRQALEVLSEMRHHTESFEYVCAGWSDPRKHMSDGTLNQMLQAMGYKGRMVPHGFRTLMMKTAMEKLGYRFEVPDLQLAHQKEGKIQAAYDRATFLDERREMMQRYADYLDSKRKPDNGI